MKKTKALKVLLVLTLIIVAVIIAVSSTYARYITAITGTDKARVAHWKVNATNEIEDLFADSYTHVVGKDGDGTAVIAPGTSGTYTFSITGSVETDYKLTINATGTDDINGAVSGYNPIKYTFQKNSETAKTGLTFAALLTEINGIDDGTTTHKAGTLPTDTYTIGWSWAIDGDDAKDTELGNLVSTADKTISLSVEISATQVNE